MRTQTNFRALIRDASTFAEKLDILTTEGGLSPGRAIMFARNCDRDGFNEYMAAKHGRTVKKRSGGGYLQHFRFIGG
jgi:hypothetical protein